MIVFTKSDLLAHQDIQKHRNLDIEAKYITISSITGGNLEVLKESFYELIQEKPSDG